MENALSKTYKLNDGTEIPSVGLGSASHRIKDSMVQAIMEAGYKHIDTASCYTNEDTVGEALTECLSKGKSRSDIYVTTKLWHTDYKDPEAALRKSLKLLNLEYVDLYLIHWPMGYYAEPRKPLHVLWAELEELVAKGLTKSIGLSNFNTQLIWDLLSYCKIKPVANQIELNP